MYSFIMLLALFCLVSSNNLYAGVPEEMKITVIYDNYPARQDMTGDWGFACLVETDKARVLFDTGAKADLFADNCRKLKIDPSGVDAVVISHNHWDHIAGLKPLLTEKRGMKVYMPASTEAEIIQDLRKTGAEIYLEPDPVEICEGIFLTGESGTSVREQGLVLFTGQGVVVLTGCAHPGIVAIAQEASEFHGEKIAGIFGGFHLMKHEKEAVDSIIKDFRALGVTFTGATHCTGEKQMKWFEEAFGDNYISLGTGKVISISRDGISHN